MTEMEATINKTDIENITNGIHDSISIDDYHANRTHVSASTLKYAAKSMRHYYYARNGAFDLNEKKMHFDFGNAFEMALLEPHNVDKYVVGFDAEDRPEPDKTFASKLNKEWKANFYEKNKDKYIINAHGKESFDALTSMIDSCLRDEKINSLIKNIEYQYSIFWKDETTGLNLKTRPDICKSKSCIVVDVKTTDDASPAAFSRAMRKFNYPLQAAMQIDGCIKSGLLKPDDLPNGKSLMYFYLVVEKNAPFNAQLYQLTDTQIWMYTEEYKTLLSMVAEATKEDKYTGYYDNAMKLIEDENVNKFHGILNLDLGYHSIFK